MTTGKSVSGAYKKSPTISERRKDMKFSVDTASTSAKGLSIISGGTALPLKPTIYFTRKAWVQQCHLVDKCNKEVGWFALVSHDADDGSFTITDIVVPKQEVSMAETDIGKEDLADAAMELIERGEDTSRMYAWFHSHVNMSVTPSGQDEYQVEDFLEDLADQPEVPAFIRGIQNKQGQLKLDVYYVQHGVAYQNVDFYVIHDDDPEWTAEIDALIKDRVKERVTYTSSRYKSWDAGPKKSIAAGEISTASFAGAASFEDFHFDNHRDYDDTLYDRSPAATSSSFPKPLLDSEAPPGESFYSMDVFHMDASSGVEVLMSKSGMLFVSDERGDVYHYNDYIDAWGEIGATV
jgi:hypothetical protein